MKKKDKLEYEFLPSALEIIETPTSTAGRLIIWLVFLTILCSILWACFAEMDEIVVATGKTTPYDDVKVIQPIENGIIEAVYVEDGQAVKQGDKLFEINSTIESSDLRNIERMLAIEKMDKELLLIQLNNTNIDGSLKDYLTNQGIKTELISDEIIDYAFQIINYDIKQQEDKEKELKKIIEERQKDLNTAKEDLNNVEKKYEIAKKSIGNVNEENPSTSIIDGDALIYELEQQVKIAKDRCNNLEEQLKQAEANLQANIEKYKYELMRDISEKEKNLQSYEESIIKAKEFVDNQKILSPIEGSVYNISSFGVGSVVSREENLIAIVPKDSKLIIEADVKNRDIGFVNVGQEVEIKMEAFDYQKYGTIKGKVTYVSPNSIISEKGELTYKIKVELEQNYLIVDGVEKNILPGMTSQIDIKIGKRKVIDFFISPIKKAKNGLKVR